MALVLALSSQVAYGHVGNSAMQFPLLRLGFQPIAVPTVLLSNRPDYPHTSRLDIPATSLADLLTAIERNGWLSGVRAVITGYMPNAEHVAVVADWISRLKALNPLLLYLCDPIIGDDPGGRYISEVAAHALRQTLLPLADIATPNAYELCWLTGKPVRTAEEAALAAQALGPETVLVTSAPADGHHRLANILVRDGEAWTANVHRRDRVPHGTGDFLAAIFAARMMQGHSAPEALALTTASMDALVSASLGAEELALAAAQEVWADPLPWPIHALALAPCQPAAAPMTA